MKQRDVSRVWLSAFGIVAIAATLPMVVLRTVSMAIAAVGGHPPYDPEAVDRFVWVVVGLTVVALCFALQSVRVRGKLAHRRVELLLLWVAFTAAVAAIAALQTIDVMPQSRYGFGVYVCLATLALVPLVSRLLSSPLPSITRFLAAASVVIALVWYAPMLIQPPWGMVDTYHSSFVINEVLAPAAGKVPLGDFIPQYTSLFGWPVAPFVQLAQSLSGSLTYFVASLYLSLLAIATMCGIVYLAWRVLPMRIRSLAILLTVPLILTSLEQPPTSGGSIARLFSALPIRTLPVVAVALTLLWFARKPQFGRVVVLGMVCGLSALNDFAFGFPTVVAALIILAVFGPLAQFPARAGGLVVGVIAVFAAYILVLAILGEPMRPMYWVAIAQGFASGFFSIEMPITGTYVLVLMILGSGAVLGLFWLSRNRDTGEGTIDPRVVSAAMVAAFIGLVGLGSFGYFVGRSSTSGQLQIFLVHTALVSVAVLGMVRVPNLMEQRSLRGVLAATLIAVPPSLAVASLIQAPDPEQEWARVMPQGSVPPLLVPDEELNQVREKLASATSALGGEVPAVAVNSGNFVALRLGVVDVSVVNYPSDTVVNPYVLQEFCQALGRADGPILAQDVVADDGQSICDGFDVVQTLGDGFAVIAKRG